MNSPTIAPTGEPHPPRHGKPPRRVPLLLYSALMMAFLLAVTVQVFLAGAGIFVDASWLNVHGIFGHVLTLIPLVLLILGGIGRLPGTLNWLTALLLALVYFQPWFIHLPRMANLPILSALHPVIALAIFTLPLYLLYRTRLVLRMYKQ